MIYRIAPKAQAALKELRDDLLRRVRFGVMSPDAARKIHSERVVEVMREARIETHADAMFRLKCGRCSVVNPVRADVITFRCSCSPATEQYAYRCRVADA